MGDLDNLQAADRLIVPLDVATETAALALVDRLPQVRIWKVGLELFVSSGPELLRLLKQRQKRIFLDLKLHDIPNTMAGACRAAARYGVDFLTVHASAGKAALMTARAAAQEGAAEAEVPPPRLLGVTLLTNISSRTLAFELKVPLELTDYTLQLALLAQDSGLGGIVCSPQEADLLRRTLSPAMTLVCPGVRPAWAQQDDQQRVLTPAQALAAGAHYLVIGRPITAAAAPEAAFQRLCQDLLP
ncbi:Orotidine 5'-phosphate decarboxylase [Halomicronema hongdechloris C2206]|uniref:Orotidine 5'-phosphate decarboxylase n=1 Tax=Halomicronema hongdechloris C2206 TaxID=1641165 RepID=A0A1Z3HFW7_9CYAN|nr:orotidine-5'-phosphate decarboxylase [Halomicronema hongdechloris]ASC69147.1 Orotidine 5'-phosphate decarboxylase [Halomicronema hongdechloris C2206]